MKYLIILLLILVILLCVYFLHKKENFMQSGIKIIEKGAIIELNNPNKQHFTLSLAFPIAMGQNDILRLGDSILVKSNLSKNNLELEVMSHNKTLAHFEKKYHSEQDVIDNIINNKLYNFAIIFNKKRCECIFESEIRKSQVEDEIQTSFSLVETVTYLYSGTVYEYEFSNKSRNYSYICNQNKTCGFECKFLSNLDDNMGPTPKDCLANCKEKSGCADDDCFKLCIDPNTRLWKPEGNRCEYKTPFGSSKVDCLKNCKKMGPNCSTLECQQVCNSCDNSSLCKWVEEEKKEKEKDEGSEEPDNLPTPPTVTLQQLDGGVILNWEKKEDENIKAYIIIYYPTQHPHKGQQVRVVKADGEEYEEKIGHLDEDQFYTFIVRAYNDKELLSPNSNQLVVKPQKYNTEVPREEILIDNLPDYYKFCNI